MQQAKGLENYHQLEQIGEGSFGKVSCVSPALRLLFLDNQINITRGGSSPGGHNVVIVKTDVTQLSIDFGHCAMLPLTAFCHKLLELTRISLQAA